MHIENLDKPFEISFKLSNECPIRKHKHTFFELVYIIEGEGFHHINENCFNYFAGNLFLLMPMDSHHFEIKQTTSFLLIRFNSIYLEAQKTKEVHSSLGEWIQKLEYIFQNSNQLQGCIIRNPTDKPLVKVIVEAIRFEYESQQTMHRELLQQLLNTLITIVARNISLYVAEKTNIAQSSPLDILQYIHQNIYQPEKLKAEHIAAHLNVSQHYISEYFKKHTNESLRQYIINYKLSLAEIRLRHSTMRLSEIAFELGFTDESHFAKTFKKYKGVSPAVYRKSVSDVAVAAV